MFDGTVKDIRLLGDDEGFPYKSMEGVSVTAQEPPIFANPYLREIRQAFRNGYRKAVLPCSIYGPVRLRYVEMKPMASRKALKITVWPCKIVGMPHMRPYTNNISDIVLDLFGNVHEIWGENTKLITNALGVFDNAERRHFIVQELRDLAATNRCLIREVSKSTIFVAPISDKLVLVRLFNKMVKPGVCYGCASRSPGKLVYSVA